MKNIKYLKPKIVEKKLKINLFSSLNDRLNSFDESLLLACSNSNCCVSCFLPQTQILMENNLIKPIEDVKEGEYVLTKETEFSNKLVKARITKKINNTVNEYLEIKLENKKKIRVTSFHPFFINDKWVKIGEAVSGDYLLDKKGEPIKIIDIKPVFKTAHIYNLKVEKYHTYFAEGIYVHNK